MILDEGWFFFFLSHYFQNRILSFFLATSALDNESEQIVQNALTDATRCMLKDWLDFWNILFYFFNWLDQTTLVIAHRLSTIRNADKIIVINNGKVVEEGNHDRLMSINGIYHDLVEQQNLLKEKEEEEDKFERQEIIRTLSEQRTRFERLRALSSCASSILDASILKELQEIDPEEINNNNTVEKLKKKKVENLQINSLIDEIQTIVFYRIKSLI